MQGWLAERNVENVELIVSDMAGIACGKIQPTAFLKSKDIKLPIAIFARTIDSDFYMSRENVVDSDMFLQPDVSTLRLVPWSSATTASVLMDCYDTKGKTVEESPRMVLRRIVEKYEARGWVPVIAPEVEFYLATCTPEHADQSADENAELQLDGHVDGYGIEGLHDLGDFFEQLTAQCRIQDIALEGISQELGPGQFEVNFHYGAPVKLADDVFHFKRTIRRVAHEHGLQLTFLAKPVTDGSGSSMHIHQSIYNDRGENLFVKPDGSNSELFEYFLGGLQTYMRDALLMFAPYANSYRRFLNHFSSPVNLEWGVDNRTVGLRVPLSDAESRRVENRLAGSDVNPYLVIAGSLACGFLGMTEKLAPRPAVEGSAYDLPFALHRHLYEALDAFRDSEALRNIFGEEFVTVYAKVKEMEYRMFQSRLTDWERNELAFIV
jgi:glutamine synthetase